MKPPYVHQPYPSWRYHKTQKARIVEDPSDEATRCPEAEGWRDSQGKADAVGISPDPLPAPVRTDASTRPDLQVNAAVKPAKKKE